MRQYSSDNVEAAWRGIDFGEGLADGTFLTETQSGPNFTTKVTARGKLIRNYMTNRSGTLQCVVDQESRLHQILKGVAIADEVSKDQVGVLKIVDTSSGEEVNFINAFISVVPNFARGTESGTFTWTFAYEKRDDKEVALTNLVGD